MPVTKNIIYLEVIIATPKAQVHRSRQNGQQEDTKKTLSLSQNSFSMNIIDQKLSVTPRRKARVHSLSLYMIRRRFFDGHHKEIDGVQNWEV